MARVLKFPIGDASEGLGLVTAHFPTHAPLHVRRNGDSFEWQNYVEVTGARA